MNSTKWGTEMNNKKLRGFIVSIFDEQDDGLVSRKEYVRAESAENAIELIEMRRQFLGHPISTSKCAAVPSALYR